jgi:signal transduction histidine kinase
MLGPLEDMLSDPVRGGDAERHHELEMVHRNGLRLLKLVNTLLDFSRIEAGRVQALYQPTDLRATTIELASVFRAAVEAAGLNFVVRCAPLRQPVFIDPEMWEKIVLNLLSNALKFTMAGLVEVKLEEAGNYAQFSVRDTGVGIPEAELPRVFERFHRIEGTRGRTHEGTGIGLALVDELVRLHGGTVEVASEHVDLSRILDEVLSVYHSRLTANHIEVTRDFEPVPQLHALRGEIHQVISNLVSNAIDAMQAGGKLRVSLNEGERGASRGVVIVVQDNGSGISIDHLHKLFEPFFTTKVSVGTGLGLWVVKQFVEEHGGTVSVDSTTDPLEHGTRFTIFLPLAATIAPKQRVM